MSNSQLHKVDPHLHVIAIIGGPKSGKHVIGSAIAEELGWPHIRRHALLHHMRNSTGESVLASTGDSYSVVQFVAPHVLP